MNLKNKGSKNILNIWIGKQKCYESKKIPKGTNLMQKWQNIKGQSSFRFTQQSPLNIADLSPGLLRTDTFPPS